MKGERKLMLVKPPASAENDLESGQDPTAVLLPEGEPEPTAEELREAEALRKALDRGDDPTALALRSAFAPASLDAGDLDAILARAMGDLDAAPTAIESAEADRLRTTLEEHDAQRAGRLIAGPGARAQLAEDSSAARAIALRAAWAPSSLGASRNEALVSRALEGAAAAKSAEPSAPVAKKGAVSSEGAAPISLRRFRMKPATYATMAAVVAMAAGVLLFVGKLGQHGDSAPASVAMAPNAAAPGAAPNAKMASVERVPRIAARSTQELFDAATPFPRSGGESARVDRIATARAADLRANRFAAWGVK